VVCLNVAPRVIVSPSVWMAAVKATLISFLSRHSRASSPATDSLKVAASRDLHHYVERMIEAGRERFVKTVQNRSVAHGIGVASWDPQPVSPLNRQHFSSAPQAGAISFYIVRHSAMDFKDMTFMHADGRRSWSSSLPDKSLQTIRLCQPGRQTS